MNSINFFSELKVVRNEWFVSSKSEKEDCMIVFSSNFLGANRNQSFLVLQRTRRVLALNSSICCHKFQYIVASKPLWEFICEDGRGPK